MFLNFFNKGYKCLLIINSFGNERKCFEYILDKVNKTSKNKAYFQTSVCLTLKQNYHVVFEGKVFGTISQKIKGEGGFGYDPIFIPDGNLVTYSQMNKAQKNKISHRSIAIKKLINFLSN